LGKNFACVARWGKQGDKRIIVVPKEYHKKLEKYTNPVKVTIEEILDNK